MAGALAARGVQSEIVTFTTTGDQRPDEPLHEIGAKGLFTAELEDALRRGAVDCCVHSLKDLPTDDPEGVQLCAVLEREDPRDVLVVRSDVHCSSLRDLPAGAVVGTSSLRRRAQLLAARPDVQARDLRGNVPTRLRKVEEGEVDAAILAAAGLHRLDRRDSVRAYLDPADWLPAPGQGAIAIQGRAGSDAMVRVLCDLDHADTRHATSAERVFLQALDGGCQVPIGALAVRTGGGRGWILHGMIAAIDGSTILRGSVVLGATRSDNDAQSLALELLQRGGAELLRVIRRSTSVPAPQPE